MVDPFRLFVLFALLGVVRLPFTLYARQQIRSNPARQAASTENVIFRTTVLLRFKNPGRRWFPQHWYRGKASPIELIVRPSTFQVTRWNLGRRSHRYGGWFLQSSETTMWVATMRFVPLGQQECIVVAGSYPWGGGARQVELALGTQGRSAEIWAALVASGVRPLQKPGGTDAPAPVTAPAQRELQGVSYGIPRAGFGAPPTTVPSTTGYPMSVAPAGPGPATGTFAPPPYVPNFESPTQAAATRGRIARRTVLTIGLVLCLPLLAVSILAHSDFGHRPQVSLGISLVGPAAVATVSGATCTVNGDEVDVAGVIAVTTPAPSGLTVEASLQLASGELGVGQPVHIPVPRIVVGVPQTFSGVITGTKAVSAGDLCALTWVATPTAPA